MMLKELLFVQEERPHYKKEWSFMPEWMLSGLNTPVCVQFLINKPEFAIGHNEDNDGVIKFSDTVSGKHLTVYVRADGCYVEDNNSTNGSYLNGESLVGGEQKAMKNGDLLQISTYHFLVERIHREE